MMDLQFVSSGSYHTYRVVDYGGPYDDCEVRLWTKAPPLVENGFKRFAYTEEEYQREIVDLVGYLRFNWTPRPSQKLMFEVAQLLNAKAKVSWDRAYEKYPAFVDPWEPLCKGVAYWDKGWIKVDLPHMGKGEDDGKRNE